MANNHNGALRHSARFVCLLDIKDEGQNPQHSGYMGHSKTMWPKGGKGNRKIGACELSSLLYETTSREIPTVQVHPRGANTHNSLGPTLERQLNPSNFSNYFSK